MLGNLQGLSLTEHSLPNGIIAPEALTFTRLEHSPLHLESKALGQWIITAAISTDALSVIAFSVEDASLLISSKMTLDVTATASLVSAHWICIPTKTKEWDEGLWLLCMNTAGLVQIFRIDINPTNLLTPSTLPYSITTSNGSNKGMRHSMKITSYPAQDIIALTTADPLIGPELSSRKMNCMVSSSSCIHNPLMSLGVVYLAVIFGSHVMILEMMEEELTHELKLTPHTVLRPRAPPEWVTSSFLETARLSPVVKQTKALTMDKHSHTGGPLWSVIWESPLHKVTHVQLVHGKQQSNNQTAAIIFSLSDAIKLAGQSTDHSQTSQSTQQWRLHAVQTELNSREDDAVQVSAVHVAGPPLPGFYSGNASPPLSSLQHQRSICSQLRVDVWTSPSWEGNKEEPIKTSTAFSSSLVLSDPIFNARWSPESSVEVDTSSLLIVQGGHISLTECSVSSSNRLLFGPLTLLFQAPSLPSVSAISPLSLPVSIDLRPLLLGPSPRPLRLGSVLAVAMDQLVVLLAY